MQNRSQNQTSKKYIVVNSCLSEYRLKNVILKLDRQPKLKGLFCTINLANIPIGIGSNEYF